VFFLNAWVKGIPKSQSIYENENITDKIKPIKKKGDLEGKLLARNIKGTISTGNTAIPTAETLPLIILAIGAQIAHPKVGATNIIEIHFPGFSSP